MAQQKGLHKIIGTIGDATYSKTKDGYQVKAKSEISPEKFATSPSMARVRENAAEFGRAGKAGKLLRLAIRKLLKNGKDNRVTSRLVKEMMRVIKADATSLRGMRNVLDGETELLQGFECNSNGTLATTFPVEFTADINRLTGDLNVAIPVFIPKEDIIAPDGATHFQIVAAGTAIDFENETYNTDTAESAVLPWNSVAVAALNLATTVPAASTHPLFLLLGIQFFQQVNGTNYSLKNGAHNALAIVKVSGI